VPLFVDCWTYWFYRLDVIFFACCLRTHVVNWFQILTNLENGLAEDGSMIQLSDTSLHCTYRQYLLVCCCNAKLCRLLYSVQRPAVHLSYSDFWATCSLTCAYVTKQYIFGTSWLHGGGVLWLRNEWQTTTWFMMKSLVYWPAVSSSPSTCVEYIRRSNFLCLHCQQ